MDLAMFTRKTCVVTGAANGIGRGGAAYFVGRGARVALLDVVETVGDVARELGGESVAYRCDLMKTAECAGILGEVRKKFGSINMFINVAGLANRTPVENITEDEWDMVCGVNLKGAFFASQQAYKFMMSDGGGRILNFSSLRSRRSDGRHLLYETSKAGIEAMTRCLAVAGGPHKIMANAIALSYVITPMTEHNLRREGWKETALRRIPMGSFLEIGDVVKLAGFLMSDENAGITGQTVVIDRGTSVKSDI